MGVLTEESSLWLGGFFSLDLQYNDRRGAGVNQNLAGGWGVGAGLFLFQLGGGEELSCVLQRDSGCSTDIATV